MLQLDLPHLNVLTKIDNLASYPPLPFNLDFYTEVQDLSYLLPHLSSSTTNPTPLDEKFQGLNKAIIELVEEFALVGFETLAVEDKRSMMTLLQAIDRAGGYAFGGAGGTGDGVWQTVMREGFRGMNIGEVQERWIDRREEFDEMERKEREEERRKAEMVGDRANRDGMQGVDDEEDEEMDSFLPDGGVKIVRR